jgi:hypothetical protein
MKNNIRVSSVGVGTFDEGYHTGIFARILRILVHGTRATTERRA